MWGEGHYRGGRRLGTRDREQKDTRRHALAWPLCHDNRRVTAVVRWPQVRVCLERQVKERTVLPSMLMTQARTGSESVPRVEDKVEEDRQETRRPARRLSREAAAGEKGRGRHSREKS